MKQRRNHSKDSEIFLDLLKDQFVVFYALTNVAIETYKTARKNYYVKAYSSSVKEKEVG